MNSFYDEPISPEHYFINAPEARTQREASQLFCSRKVFREPRPPPAAAASSERIIHEITHPASIDTILNRQVFLWRNDDKIRKCVRIGWSNLKFEKEVLETVKSKTSVPVPQVYDYYSSVEFEHLILQRQPGITLEQAWRTLSLDEKTRIADQVVCLLGEIRNLHSPNITAALYLRKPLRADVKTGADFISERFGVFMDNDHVARYVEARVGCLNSLPIVLTHGDLDRSNILVEEDRKVVSGIIDWECGGYFPAYWEWLTVKQFCRNSDTTDEDGGGDSWFELLERRLRPPEQVQVMAVWELERLHKALGRFTEWALAPEARQENRARGWAEVCGILDLDIDKHPPPAVVYAISSEHPLWLENRHA